MSFTNLCFFILLVGCSQQIKKIGQVGPEESFGGVSVEEISETYNERKAIRVNDPGQMRYKGVGPRVPALSFETLFIKKGEKIPVISLVLSPGINRVAAHVSFLKMLSREKIPIHIISGTGLSAIMALMYARGYTPEKIEWNFYKFFHAAKEVRPYTEEWYDVVDEVLLQQFKGLKFQDIETSFVLPLYSIEKKKIIYLSRGPLYENLRMNFYFYGDGHAGPYKTALQWGSFYSKYFRARGADLLIGIDVLCDKINLKYGDSFIIGAFGKVITHIREEKNRLDLFVSLPICEMPLDSVDDLPTYLLRSDKKNDALTKDVYSLIQNWQKNKLNIRKK